MSMVGYSQCFSHHVQGLVIVIQLRKDQGGRLVPKFVLDGKVLFLKTVDHHRNRIINGIAVFIKTDGPAQFFVQRDGVQVVDVFFQDGIILSDVLINVVFGDGHIFHSEIFAIQEKGAFKSDFDTVKHHGLTAIFEKGEFLFKGLDFQFSFDRIGLYKL